MEEDKAEDANGYETLEATGSAEHHVLVTNRTSVGAEVKRVLALAVPISASEVLSFASYMITTAQVGRLSRLDLSALTLARTFFHITGLSLVVGMSSGMSTFCGQAFGAQQYRVVGTTLQRAVLICLLTTLPVFALWTQTKPILMFLGQEEAIAELATHYTALLVPALMLWSISQCLRNYFTSQAIVMPLTAVALLLSAITPFINYHLIYTFDLGVNGVAISYSILYGIELMALICLLVWHHRQQPPEKRTWVPWTGDSLRGWPAYLKIAIPSLLMICLDWWCFEAMILIAGSLSNAQVQLASMGLCFSTHALVFMANEGFSGAARTRVSNELGAGRSGHAQTATLVCLLFGVLISGASGAVLLAARHHWGRLFTRDQAIIDTVSQAMPFLAASLISDSCSSILSGVLSGSGRQLLGFITNLVCFWILGIPLAMVMAHYDHGTVGLWLAMACVSSLQALVLSICIARFNWRNEARRAQRMVGAGAAGIRGGSESIMERAFSANAITSHVHGAYEPTLVDSHVNCDLTSVGGAMSWTGGRISLQDSSSQEPLLQPHSLSG